MYVDPNFKTKKALREAIGRGQIVQIFTTGPFPAPLQGVVSIEGPWFPEPHQWYARVELKDGRVVKVIS